MNNNKKGFLKVYRRFFDHFLWKESREFSKAEAWIDILRSARYDNSTTKEFFSGNLIEWGRGEFPASVRFLKERWNWGSNGKVKRFLDLLVDEGMIEVRTEQGQNVLSICNYTTYNPLEEDEQNSNGTATEQQRNEDRTETEQNSKKVKKVKKEKNKTLSSSDSDESDTSKETKMERLARLNNMDLDLAETTLEELSTQDFQVPKDESNTDDGLNYLTMAFYEAMAEVNREDKTIRTTKFAKWRNHIRLMYEQDERSLKEIYKGIKAFENNWWNDTCQSTGNFRDNFLKILTSKDRNGKQRKIPSEQGFDKEKAKRDLSGLEFED